MGTVSLLVFFLNPLYKKIILEYSKEYYVFLTYNLLFYIEPLEAKYNLIHVTIKIDETFHNHFLVN